MSCDQACTRSGRNKARRAMRKPIGNVLADAGASLPIGICAESRILFKTLIDHVNEAERRIALLERQAVARAPIGRRPRPGRRP